MTKDLFSQLANLYERMHTSYNLSAKAAGLSCEGCITNCCTSYFQHHTYIEWLYLWKGMRTLATKQRMAVLQRAKANVNACNQRLSMQVQPKEMCPINEEGLCVLYPYRLMICRMHGTRNSMTTPDGKEYLFSGCEQFTALFPKSKNTQENTPDVPTLDRTSFYQELAQLEISLLKKAKQPMPRVRLTLAEMLCQGAPRL